MAGSTGIYGNDCALCEDAARERGDMPWWARDFIVCPTCGNKRCPKATWHDNPCSGSNEPGQVGSVYGREPYKLTSADPKGTP